MQISGLSPVGVTPQPRGREQDGAPTDQDGQRRRSSFSRAHVILDLSVEALQQVGHEPIAVGRRKQPPLFIYNNAGAFAYNEPERPPAPALVLEMEDKAEEVDVLETPMPKSVTFEGMLGA